MPILKYTTVPNSYSIPSSTNLDFDFSGPYSTPVSSAVSFEFATQAQSDLYMSLEVISSGEYAGSNLHLSFTQAYQEPTGSNISFDFTENVTEIIDAKLSLEAIIPAYPDIIDCSTSLYTAIDTFLNISLELQVRYAEFKDVKTELSAMARDFCNINMPLQIVAADTKDLSTKLEVAGDTTSDATLSLQVQTGILQDFNMSLEARWEAFKNALLYLEARKGAFSDLRLNLEARQRIQVSKHYLIPGVGLLNDADTRQFYTQGMVIDSTYTLPFSTSGTQVTFSLQTQFIHTTQNSYTISTNRLTVIRSFTQTITTVQPGPYTVPVGGTPNISRLIPGLGYFDEVDSNVHVIPSFGTYSSASNFPVTIAGGIVSFALSPQIIQVNQNAFTAQFGGILVLSTSIIKLTQSTLVPSGGNGYNYSRLIPGVGYFNEIDSNTHYVQNFGTFESTTFQSVVVVDGVVTYQLLPHKFITTQNSFAITINGSVDTATSIVTTTQPTLLSSVSSPYISRFIPGIGCLTETDSNTYYVPDFGTYDSDSYFAVSIVGGSASYQMDLQQITIVQDSFSILFADGGITIAPSIIITSQSILPPSGGTGYVSRFIPGIGCLTETDSNTYYVPDFGTYDSDSYFASRPIGGGFVFDLATQYFVFQQNEFNARIVGDFTVTPSPSVVHTTQFSLYPYGSALINATTLLSSVPGIGLVQSNFGGDTRSFFVGGSGTWSIYLSANTFPETFDFGTVLQASKLTTADLRVTLLTSYQEVYNLGTSLETLMEEREDFPLYLNACTQDIQDFKTSFELVATGFLDFSTSLETWGERLDDIGLDLDAKFQETIDIGTIFEAAKTVFLDSGLELETWAESFEDLSSDLDTKYQEILDAHIRLEAATEELIDISLFMHAAIQCFSDVGLHLEVAGYTTDDARLELKTLGESIVDQNLDLQTWGESRDDIKFSLITNYQDTPSVDVAFYVAKTESEDASLILDTFGEVLKNVKLDLAAYIEQIEDSYLHLEVGTEGYDNLRTRLFVTDGTTFSDLGMILLVKKEQYNIAVSHTIYYEVSEEGMKGITERLAFCGDAVDVVTSEKVIFIQLSNEFVDEKKVVTDWYYTLRVDRSVLMNLDPLASGRSCFMRSWEQIYYTTERKIIVPVTEDSERYISLNFAYLDERKISSCSCSSDTSRYCFTESPDESIQDLGIWLSAIRTLYVSERYITFTVQIKPTFSCERHCICEIEDKTSECIRYMYTESCSFGYSFAINSPSHCVTFKVEPDHTELFTSTVTPDIHVFSTIKVNDALKNIELSLIDKDKNITNLSRKSLIKIYPEKQGTSTTWAYEGSLVFYKSPLLLKPTWKFLNIPPMDTAEEYYRELIRHGYLRLQIGGNDVAWNETLILSQPAYTMIPIRISAAEQEIENQNINVSFKWGTPYQHTKLGQCLIIMERRRY